MIHESHENSKAFNAAKYFTLWTICLSHTLLVMKHFLFPYNVPIIIITTRVLITAKVEEINILDQGIISLSESLACINSSLFPLKASYWDRYRVFGA